MRGGEVFLTEGSKIMKRVNYGKLYTSDQNVAVLLMGRFKGVEGARNILLALANRTATSDIRIRRWDEGLSAVLVQKIKTKGVGPAFCDKYGYVLSQYFLNMELQTMVTDIEIEQTYLFDKDISVDRKFSIFQLF